MQKKVTYATTGTRIVVRFFGGWDFTNDDLYRPNVVSIGYDKAVSDGRTIGEDGRCRTPVGNTVDTANATYLNNIGDAEMRVHKSNLVYALRPDSQIHHEK
jgi:hypothetical protein